jgi:hypothetical protein
MAIYRELTHLKSGYGIAFDTVHVPGDLAPQSGIYRCDVCGREIAIAEDHALPSGSHPKHRNYSNIRWRLLVFAESDACVSS